MNEDAIFEQKADYIGPADYNDLYRLLWDYFNDLGFRVQETEYRVVRSVSGEDILIKWECTKKSGSYTQFKIKVGFTLFGVRDVEVLQNGVKTTIPQGVFKMKFNANLMSGNKDWESNPFLKVLARFYENYFYGRKINVWNEPKEKPFSDPARPLHFAFGQFKFQMETLLGVVSGAVNETKSFFGLYQ
ncbi:hypothetical protein COT72_04400 [archaeon CG10_big_fil_rev_8_21_14_0_10_43_11]|nr:MAG: hypothetical protein COT72_04400 [archaeon CG10_big_fil_rev_8_21_14_0_10_43_11]